MCASCHSSCILFARLDIPSSSEVARVMYICCFQTIASGLLSFMYASEEDVYDRPRDSARLSSSLA
jgi:hypothetical protein